MEYWEVTKQRAQATLSVWTQFVPTLKIGTKGSADLATLLAQYEPLVQARVDAQDGYDGAYRAVQDTLQKLRVLGTRVPAIIEAMLDENETIMQDVDDLFGTSPRAEASILKRARGLYPVWMRANAALAALTPAQPPITRVIAGVPYTAALLKGLLDGYTAMAQAASDKGESYEEKRSALRLHDRAVDQLNKRWYKGVKASFDPGMPAYDALRSVPTEPAMPAPEPVEIESVTQGGEEGLQVLVAYVPGGGGHASEKKIQWQVVGKDADFTQSANLDLSGNALGPLPQGTTVRLRTLVKNSAATRTTSVRTITLGPPIV